MCNIACWKSMINDAVKFGWRQFSCDIILISVCLILTNYRTLSAELHVHIASASSSNNFQSPVCSAQSSCREPCNAWFIDQMCIDAIINCVMSTNASVYLITGGEGNDLHSPIYISSKLIPSLRWAHVYTTPIYQHHIKYVPYQILPHYEY